MLPWIFAYTHYDQICAYVCFRNEASGVARADVKLPSNTDVQSQHTDCMDCFHNTSIALESRTLEYPY